DRLKKKLLGPDQLEEARSLSTQTGAKIQDALVKLGYATPQDVAAFAEFHRSALRAAFAAIGSYERELGAQFLAGLQEIRGVRVWGITDPARLGERVPTVAVTLDRLPAKAVAEELGRRGIFTWAGNFYALEVVEALGLSPAGVVRLGLLH